MFSQITKKTLLILHKYLICFKILFCHLFMLNIFFKSFLNVYAYTKEVHYHRKKI